MSTTRTGSKKIPPIKGAVPIILAWFFSPCLTATASALIYGLNRYFVLQSKDSAQRSCWVLPILIFVTVMINIYFVFTKGAKKTFAATADDWTDDKVPCICAMKMSCSCVQKYVLVSFVPTYMSIAHNDK